MASRLFLGAVLVMAVLSVTPSKAYLTDAQKEELLNAQNFYRSRVSPVATNMAKLEWDEELAAMAQFYSVDCMIEPNEKKHEQSTEFDYVGEILDGSANYTINLTSMVFGWFFEGRNYQISTATCIDEDGNEAEEGCERFLQMVWAQTRKVGCGGYRCEDIEGLEDEEVEEGQTALMVVCYYGPGGGASGEAPYQTGGQACSSCPSDLPDCDERNLCYDSGAPRTVAHVSIAMMFLIVGVLSSLL